MRLKVSQHKENGATFTPTDLANYLAEEILKVYSVSAEEEISILDPACGDGELLLSIGDALRKDRSKDFQLIGYDLNEKYVNQATKRLNESPLENYHITEADFLLEPHLDHVDIVIANPPYVRTQILGESKAQALAKKYNLKGRVDLYYPFLIEMTNSLKEGGIIGVITSNRYLFTKSGGSIRKFLSQNYEIIKVIDLGDTKLFENAAVLPAIFIGKKRTLNKSKINRSSFLKVYEQHSTQNGHTQHLGSVYEILNSDQSGTFKVNDKYFKQTHGTLITQDNDNNWQMLTEAEQAWVDGIDQASRFRIKDLAKVRVGVKTTADNVFISDKWSDLNEDEKPEGKLLLPLISQNNVKKWQHPFSSDHKILYTHELRNGKKVVINLSEYPKAANYLDSHREQLSSRNYVIKAKRQWFEIWVPQRPRLWPKAKLVFPDISEEPRFYLDMDGAVVNGNCYWISVEDTGSIDLLLLIQGISNSSVIAKYHDLRFNNRLYAGRRRYFTQYVENYPLPDPNSLESMEIIALTKQLNQLSKKGKPISHLEMQLNELVIRSFGLKAAHPLD